MAGAGEVRAGAAYVEMKGKDAGLNRAIGAAIAAVKSMGTTINSIGARLSSAGAAVMGQFGVSVEKLTSGGVAMLQLSQRTGFSVEALSELNFAAERSGVSIEVLEAAITAMSKNLYAINSPAAAAGASIDDAMGAAVEGSSKAAKTLAALGLSAKDLMALPIDQRFGAILDKLAAVSDPGQRAAAGMAILGKQATALLPMLAGGARGLAALKQEAQDLGIVMSADKAMGAKALLDASNKYEGALKGIKKVFAGAFTPILTDLFTIAVPFVNLVRNWVKENKALATALAGVTMAAVVLGGALSAGGLAIKLMTPAVGLLTAGLGLLAGAAKLALLPLTLLTFLPLAKLGLLAAGVAGAIGIGAGIASVMDRGFAGTWEGIKSGGAGAWEFVSTKAVSAWQSVSTTAKTAWGGIVDALRSGNIDLAMKIAVAGLKLEWMKLSTEVKAIWADLVFEWDSTLQQMKRGWDDVMYDLGQPLDGLLETIDLIREGFDQLGQGFKDLGDVFKPSNVAGFLGLGGLWDKVKGSGPAVAGGALGGVFNPANIADFLGFGGGGAFAPAVPAEAAEKPAQSLWDKALGAFSDAIGSKPPPSVWDNIAGAIGGVFKGEKPDLKGMFGDLGGLGGILGHVLGGGIAAARTGDTVRGENVDAIRKQQEELERLRTEALPGFHILDYLPEEMIDLKPPGDKKKADIAGGFNAAVLAMMGGTSVDKEAAARQKLVDRAEKQVELLKNLEKQGDRQDDRLREVVEELRGGGAVVA